MNPETVVCRCCETTYEEILVAIEEGAASLDEVKRRTRAGMGLCQGKTCAPIVQRILSEAADRPARPTVPSARVPVRPVALAAVAALAVPREPGDSGNTAAASVPGDAGRQSSTSPSHLPSSVSEMSDDAD